MSDFGERVSALAHPMTTAATGVATSTAVLITNDFITALPLIHQIVSVIALTLGAAASGLGLYVQYRNLQKTLRAERQRALSRRATDVHVHKEEIKND
jgi:hypothetical protein